MRNKQAIAVLLLAIASVAFATKYAGDFEELGVSARSVGMGSATTALTDDPAALYYNPAATVLQTKRSVMLMHAENFGGLVQNNFASVVLPAEKSAFGFGLLNNGVSGIKLTELLNPDLPLGAEFVYTRDTFIDGRDTTLTDTVLNTPRVTRTVSAMDWLAYFNYSRALTSWLAIGGNAKVIYRTTGVSTCFGMGVDIGALAQPARDMTIGLRVRNVTTSPLFWDTKTRESMMPRPVLAIGQAFHLGDNHRFFLDAEVEGNLEGLPLEENLGAEYRFKELLSGRIGFHRGGFTFGLGGEYKGFFIDYAYEAAPYAEARDLPASQKVAGGYKF